MAVLKLVTIPISHYCEKARWALDRAALAYHEEPHVQGIHRFAARRAGGGSTVPVLVTPQGAIGDSQLILRWVDARLPEERRLFPSTPSARVEVEALCARFDGELGPKARRLMYVHMLAQPKLALGFNNHGVPRWEDRAMRGAWPLFRGIVRRALEITDGVEREDEASVFAEFDEVAERLADGRPYLCGERFGAADLTFAALSAAVTVPPTYGVQLPQPALLPSVTAELIERARAHPAGRYAMRLFAEHRASALAPRFASAGGTA